MHRLSMNVCFALRLFARQPGLSATLVLILALGVGTTTAFFAVVHGAVLRPLPFPDADRLVVVEQVDPELGASPFAPPFLEDLRERVGFIEELSGFSASWELTLTGLGEPRRVTGAYVSHGVFELLGVAPVRGRAFDAAEHLQGGPRAVVVSQPFLERHFGVDGGVEGGVDGSLDGAFLQLDGERYRIVGVMPDFHLPITASLASRNGGRAELWLPFAANPFAELRAIPVMNVVGKVAADFPVDRGAALLDATAAELRREYPESFGAGTTLVATSLHDIVTREGRATFLMLLGGAALLLLIACTNVGNVLLARASAREQEFAVRRSLGAGRGRIFEQLLTESLLVAALGCGAGLILAGWLIQGVLALDPEGLPPTAAISMNLPVAGFAVAVSAASALLFGAWPALRAGDAEPAGMLGGGARITGAGGGTRRLLVSAEVALSVMLLVGAGLLAQSFWKLVHVDPGFRAEHLLQLPVSMGSERYASAESRRAFLDELLPSLNALPGVARVGAVNRLPLAGDNVMVGAEIKGAPLSEGSPPTLDRRVATPGYFDLMSIPIVAGREFDASDRPDAAAPAVIVNETFVRRFWPASDGLDRRLRLMLRSGPGPWLRVVGVAGDVRHHGLDRAPAAEVYVPYDQASVEGMIVLLRTSVDPASVAASARDAVWQLDPELPLDGTGPVSRLMRESADGPRIRAFILNGFAALALLLAGIGIFGVISWSVTRRTREIGLHLALGAQAGTMLRRVMREGLLLAGWGVIAGLAGAWLLSRLLSGFLFGVEPADPATFVGAAAVVLLVALAATWLPAQRAARVDPMQALRAE